jgi:predicted HicB family RNase H-like nuclease
MTLENDFYTYRITWVEEDNEYVGLCAEFPSLSWLAPTPESALAGIREVVAEVIADMKANMESIPEPIAVRKYSGNLLVKVSPEVHRRLAVQAAEAKVSLNQIVSVKLSIEPQREQQNDDDTVTKLSTNQQQPNLRASAAVRNETGTFFERQRFKVRPGWVYPETFENGGIKLCWQTALNDPNLEGDHNECEYCNSQAKISLRYPQ